MKPILFFFAFFGLAESSAQTYISGTINTSATWDKTNSPYILSGNVVIHDSITLTILPGTIVLFDTGSGMELRGKLNAKGTLTDTIYFTSRDGTSYWKGIKASGSYSQMLLEYGSCQLAQKFILGNAGPYGFKHCYFANNATIGRMQYGYCDSCYFEHNGVGPEGPVTVSNSKFVNNRVACKSHSTINCSFVNSSDTALIGDIVNNCRFYNNNVAVVSPILASGNDIHDNNIGLLLNYQAGVLPQWITANKICHNNYNIYQSCSTNLSVAQNCWCLPDSVSIRAKIFDGYRNAVYGVSNYMPFDTCAATPALACDIPANMSIHITQGANRIIHWDFIAGDIGYEYVVLKDINPYAIGTPTKADSATFDPSMAGSLYYKVGVRTRCSDTSFSNWVYLADSLFPTGMFSENTNRTFIKLYPNPATGILNIETNAANSNIAFTVTDLMGKTVMTSKLTAPKQAIDVSQWPAGMYFVKCEGKQGTEVVKFLKQ